MQMYNIIYNKAARRRQHNLKNLLNNIIVVWQNSLQLYRTEFLRSLSSSLEPVTNGRAIWKTEVQMFWFI
jgi:hypothetical protein